MNLKLKKINHEFSSLVEMLKARSSKSPDRLIYRFLNYSDNDSVAENEITYSVLDRNARSIACWFQDRKASGERALLLYPPGLDYINAYFGCLYAGIIAVPAYPPLSPKLIPRIESIVSSADAKYIMTISPIMNLIRSKMDAGSNLHSMEWVATDTVGIDAWNGYRDMNIPPESIAFLQYTSGSTSAPKGVILTHDNLLHNEQIIKKSFECSSDSVCVIWLPPYHDMGLIGGILQPVYADFPCSLISPMDFLQRPLRWLQAITRYRGTVSGGPNFAYELCNRKISDKEIEDLDLSSWDTAFNGAESIRVEVLDEFARRFSRAGFRSGAVYPCYGLAESTLIVSGGRKHTPPVVKHFDRDSLEKNRAIETNEKRADTQTLVGCGQALDDGTITIVDPEAFEECQDGSIGEIWVSGPSVASGYWGCERAESEKVFSAYTKNFSGPYLRTGDLGFLLNGELFVTGRLKDIIIIRGRNYYPQDIEYTAERSHPSLRSGCCAAFSVDHDGEERIIIVQEVRAGLEEKIDEQEIRSAIATSVSEQHELSVFRTVLIKPGSMPKTSSGKIQRRACRDAFIENRLAEINPSGNNRLPSVSTVNDEVYQTPVIQANEEFIRSWLVNKIAEKRGVARSKIDIHSTFSSFGLVSVDIVSITGELETLLKRRISPASIYNYPTIDTFTRFLSTSEESSQGEYNETGQPAAPGEPVAIIGIGCRFPGGADSPDKFYKMLRDGVDAVTNLPGKRAFTGGNGSAGSAMRGGFIDDVDLFDPFFFNISPKEAVSIDPQQRLLLEVTWEAFEDAGITLKKVSERKTGVFIGISNSDYSRIKSGDEPGLFEGTGNALSIASNRISYLFDLKGPSMSIDTACSSSLVAVHLAVNSIRNGESEIAIAGGVNLILSNELTDILTDAKMLSPDGRCKTFDADANGYVRGEGCGIIIMKPLGNALRDHNRIYAVVRGSAVNQDGRSNGLTAPNGLSQQDVIERALENAGVNPCDIDYIEAHGTGTPLGDPIELNSVMNVLKRGRKENRCHIGSVKTNIGHLEPAAGIAGLIKAVLCLKNREFVPLLHLKKLNPHISTEGNAFKINTAPEPWDAPHNRPRLAGVSSFGMGGTNSHIVIQEAPETQNSFLAGAVSTAASHSILCLSAKREQDLKEITSAFQKHISEKRRDSIQDICFSANIGREHFAHRVAFLGRSEESLKEKLESYNSGGISSGIIISKPGIEVKTGGIAFMFTGQGAQYHGMGGELYNTHPAFRRSMDQCHAILNDRFKLPLLDILYGDNREADINDTALAQPALFSVEYSLAQLWISWGLMPGALIGHSVGEYAAACLAGVFTVEEGLMLTAARGRLMSMLPADGTMVSVMVNEQKALELISRYDDVSIAAVNTANSVVISGGKNSIAEITSWLERSDIPCRELKVSHPFHSPAMERMLPEFGNILQRIDFREPQIPVVSNITAQFLSGEQCTGSYWGEHILKPVNFIGGIEFLLGKGFSTFIETGPGQVLSGYARQITKGKNSLVISSLLRGSEGADHNDWHSLLAGLGELYVSGADIDWDSFYSPFNRRMVSVPGYPFDRKRYWKSKPSAPIKSEGIHQRDDTAGSEPVPIRGLTPDTPSGQLISIMKEHASIMREQTRMISDYLASNNGSRLIREQIQEILPESAETSRISSQPVGGVNVALEKSIIELISKISAYPQGQIERGMRFLDGLGFDSLMVTDLMNRISKAYPEYSSRSKDIIRFIITSNATITDLVKLLAGMSGSDSELSASVLYSTDRSMSDTAPVHQAEDDTAAADTMPQSNITIENIPEEFYRVELMPGYVELNRMRGSISGRNPYSRVNEGIALDTVSIGGGEFINFATFGYLGLNGAPEIAHAVSRAVAKYGTSVSGSRLLSGEIPLHGELEAEISGMLGTEDAVVYTGGHTTNVATIGYLFGPSDLIIHDSLAHNSIVQGSLMSGAARRPFPHNNWEALDAILTKLRGHYRRVLVALEGVYSMDGDIPELPEFIRVKNRHRALLMIDEAHSLGVLGRTGRGITEHFGASPQDVDILMGTLSKAIPSCGGYIAGKRALTDNLRHSAPGFIFSTGISPSNTAAALASLQLMMARPELVERLRSNSRLFLKLAKEQGLNTGTSRDTPVVPVITGNSGVCIELSKALYERGINVMPIIYPAVDENKARLRFFLSALHTEEQIKKTVVAVAEELEKLTAI